MGPDISSCTLKLGHNCSRSRPGSSGNYENYEVLCCPACCEYIQTRINQDSNSYNATNSLNSYLVDRQYCDGDDIVTTPVLHWKLLYGYKSPFQLTSHNSPSPSSSNSSSSSPSPSVDDAAANHSNIVVGVDDDAKTNQTVSLSDPLVIKADHSNIECKSPGLFNRDNNQEPINFTAPVAVVATSSSQHNIKPISSAEPAANSTTTMDAQHSSKVQIFMKHPTCRRLNKLARVSSSRFVHHSPHIDMPSHRIAIDDDNITNINFTPPTASAARETSCIDANADQLSPPHQALSCACLHLMDYKTLLLNSHSADKPETTTAEAAAETDQQEPIKTTEASEHSTKHRVRSSGMASDQAAIISSLTERLSFVEENQSRNSTMVSKLRLEVHDLSTRIQELEFSHASALREIHGLLQRFADQMTMSRRKEQEKIKMALVHMKEEMEEERASWRLLKVQNKKLEKELTDANMTAVDACEELEKERKARELLEEVCNELAKEIGEDKAEVEKLKKEQAKSRERLEEELKLMRMAVRWREERVRAKLSEAQCELDHGKQSAMSLQEVKSKLAAFVESVGAAVDFEFPSVSASSREQWFQGLYGKQASILRQGLELLHLHENGAEDVDCSLNSEICHKNDAGINSEADYIASKTTAQPQFVTLPSADQVRASISHSGADQHEVNTDDHRPKIANKKHQYKTKGGASHACLVPKQKEGSVTDSNHREHQSATDRSSSTMDSGNVSLIFPDMDSNVLLKDRNVHNSTMNSTVYSNTHSDDQEPLKESKVTPMVVRTADDIDVIELNTSAMSTTPSTTVVSSSEQKSSTSTSNSHDSIEVLNAESCKTQNLHQVPAGKVMQNKKSCEGPEKHSMAADSVHDGQGLENESEDFYFEPVIMHDSDLNCSSRIYQNAKSSTMLSAEFGPHPKMRQGVVPMATSGPLPTTLPAAQRSDNTRINASEQSTLSSGGGFGRSLVDQGVGAYLFSKPAIRGYQVLHSQLNSKQTSASSASSSPWRRIPHTTSSTSGFRSPAHVGSRSPTGIFTDASPRNRNNIPDQMITSLWLNAEQKVTKKESSNDSIPVDNSDIMMQHQSSTSTRSTSAATSPTSYPGGIIKSNSLRAQLMKARELEAISAIVPPPPPSPKPPLKLAFRFSPLRNRSAS